MELAGAVYHAALVTPCLFCDACAWRPLADPHAERAVLSDLRIVNRPLARRACTVCGVVTRCDPGREGYASAYALYDHRPGHPREVARHSAYAAWLSARLEYAPRRVLDIGCGNGSLLLALGRRWPHAALQGLDPSIDSVRHARAAGVDASACALAEATPEPVDLVVAVNVIEHVTDPVTFLAQAAAWVRPSGTVLIACPDGGSPSVELLFADHVWSFTAWHLSALAHLAGLETIAVSTAPPELGAFQLLHAVKPTQGRARRPGPPPAAHTHLPARKHAYLQEWADLDLRLIARAAGAPALTCFGIGEAAGLLRAYAPATWSRVVECVADDPEHPSFGDLPVHPWPPASPGRPVLLGARPSAQPALAARLLAAEARVIRWDDHIPA